MSATRLLAAAIAIASLAACSVRAETRTVQESALEHGRALFSDPSASGAVSNPFACATCHAAEGASGRIFPGGDLTGVTTRTSLWGGGEDDLLASINDCRRFFMDAPSPWTADDEEARATYAFLESQAAFPGPAIAAIPFTVVSRAVDLAPGDATHGKEVYALACHACHGELHSGAGRLASFIPVLPDEVIAQHQDLGPSAVRLVVIGKVRRGGIYTDGQSMPPFAREVLADDDVAGLLALFGL